MTQAIETLLSVLVEANRNQTAELENLDALLEQQRQALIERDAPTILASLAEQSARIEAVQNTEQQRQRAQENLAAALGVRGEALTLAKISEQAGAAARSLLEPSTAELRTAMERVGRSNADNRRLIEHSLDFVGSMLSALSGSTTATPTYEATGSMRPRAQVETLIDHTA